MNKLKKCNFTLLFTLLIVLLLAVTAGSLFIGRYHISFTSFIDLIGLRKSADENLEQSQIIFFQVRVVRILAALMIGAALSLAGSAYQGIFRNPMVSPDILGAAAGAGFGAAMAISLGLNAVLVQLLAFAGGIIAVLIAYLLSTAIGRRGGEMTLILVLTGMVVSALFTALISIVKYIGDPYDTLPAITFWLMGGLSYVTAADLMIMLAPLLLGGTLLLLLRWRLNILTLSDEESDALGVNTIKLRAIVIVCATLLSTASVAVGGMIGWVGLIIPHFARMLAGPDYKRLLPAAMMIGSIFLLAVDDVARGLFAMELPLGILTALIGAPFFLVLLFHGRRKFL